MVNDLRRTLGLPREPKRRRIGPSVIGLATVALVVVLAVVFAGRLGSPGVERAAAAGATDRITFDRIRVGSPQLDVRSLLREPPRDIRERASAGEARECWAYGRRSGLEGGYRFCFADGRLASKDRLARTPG